MIRIVYFEEKIDSDAATFGRKLTEILKKKYGAPVDVSEGKKVKVAWVTADTPPHMPILLEGNPGEDITVNYYSLAYNRVLKKRNEQNEEQDKKSQEDF